MSLADKQAAVLAAELRCEGQREHARDMLGRLGTEFRRSATPLRIVVSGLALGFVSGLRTPGAGPISTLGGQLISGPLMSMLTESVLPGLLAGVTAAATAQAGDGDPAESEAAADAGTAEAIETDEADVEAEAAAPPETEAPKRRRRKNRRVDA